jgi:hypothetical protein
MKAAGFLPLLLIGIGFGLQPEVAGVEAVLRDDVSISSRASIRVGKWDAPVLQISESDTVYLRFDVDSVLPAGTTAGQVAKATLRLWVSKVSTPGLCGIYPVTSVWNERSPIGLGFDLLPPALGTRAALVPHYFSKAFLVADVTPIVRGWLSGTPNYGLAVRGAFRGPIVYGPTSERIVDDDPVSELTVPLVARVDSKENTASGHPATLQVVLTGSNP